MGGSGAEVLWNGTLVHLTSLHATFFLGGVCFIVKCILHDLKKIRASCGLVTQDLLQSVEQECVERWLECLEIGGSHVKV